MKVENIKTEIGNEILIQLKKDGWFISDQYDQCAIDKGIDFDSYTLKKGEEELQFEWSNWFEWEVQGSESEIQNLIKKFKLQNT